MTKAKIKNIYYIGGNEDYVDEISIFFNKASNKGVLEYKIIQLKDLDQLLQSIHLDPPSLIIADYCHNKYENNYNPNFLRIIHQYQPYKSVPLVAIVKDELQCHNSEFLFRYGISLIHIAGNDLDQFLQNSFYIIYESPLDVQKYALAKGFELPYQMSNLSFIYSLGEENFSIDNDIGNESEVALQTYFFSEPSLLNCPVVESYAGGMGSCTYYNHLVKIPFASGWDDEYDNVIESDTYSAWLENHQDEFLPYKSKVLHYSKSIESTILTQKIDHDSVYYSLYYEYDGKDKEIYKIDPDLVIYEVTDDKSEEQLHHLFSEYTYSAQSAHIIYLVFNSKDSSEELREQYNYEKIIATDKLPHIELVNKMINSLPKKEDTDHFHFKLTDRRLCCETFLDVKITSLTENEISFKSEIEIPFYTILKIDTPLKMYLLTVPAKVNLSPNPNGFHYQALICGIDFHSSEYLRKLVNTFIKEPPKQWKKLDINHELDDSEQQPKDDKIKPEKKEEIEIIKTNPLEESRRKTKGLKSKL